MRQKRFTGCFLKLTLGLFFLHVFLLDPFSPAVCLHAEQMGIVAVVNDDVITQSDLDMALAPVYLQMQNSTAPEEMASKAEELREEVLQQLIEESLLLQEAHQPKPVEFGKNKIGTPSPIEVTEFEVDKMVKQVTSKFPTVEEFNQALKEQGLTIENLRDRFKKQITIKKLIGRQVYSRIVVAPSEVTSYYQEHQREFMLPAAVKVAVIVIRTKKGLDALHAKSLADNLHQQILSGGDFYDLAARYTDGPNPKMGGRIGFLDQGRGMKEIDVVLFKLKAGDISPVIEAGGAFYIFRVEEFRPAEQATLDSVKDLVQDKLFQKKGSVVYKEWIDKLKENAYISIK